MKVPRRIRRFLKYSAAAAIVWLMTGTTIQAQAPPATAPKPPAAAPKPPTAKKPTTKKPGAAAAQPATPAKRPPMTKPDVEKLWAQQQQELFLNELRLRQLAFEPDEEWLSSLPKATKVEAAAVPQIAAELRKLIPPAPDVDEVSKQAAGILAKLKEAAQKRSESDLESVVHPDLMSQKAKVYDLFDTTNYRNHSLGKFSSQEYRRVGVQFFQLTTSQVERLHYVQFAMSRGNIVVRDVITGPEVAELFLRDEQKLALSKLDLVFRALNDGDDSGLKNLCTPGLFDSLKELAGEKQAGGSRITRGPRTVSQIEAKASVPLDQKSIRVIVRVGYPTRSGKKIEYDVDFERIDNDLKVVRLRDVQGRVVAWDPNIDNYLNRRFGLPDGPVIARGSIAESDLPYFFPLSRVRKFAERAIEDRNAQKLKEYAEEFLDSEPSGGVGYGLRAAANHMLGNYEEAEKDAMLAIERGGTAYFTLLRHSAFNTQQFWPVVLGVSKSKVEYLPPTGQGGGGQQEEIPIATVEAKFESPKFRIIKPRPFLSLEFRSPDQKKDKKEYNFAAFGTGCPGEVSPGPTKLIPYTGGSVCAGQSNGTTVPIPGGGQAPMLVPEMWRKDLTVVLRVIEEAKNRGSQRGQR